MHTHVIIVPARLVNGGSNDEREIAGPRHPRTPARIEHSTLHCLRRGLAGAADSHDHSMAAGGSTDIVGRILAADLGARLKQQVIIDNRAGAGSIVGLQVATASPPDGYTFMMTS